MNLTRSWFLQVARFEGLSLIALFFVAMPLKYVGGIAEPVAWVGWIHGTLVFLYVIALGSMWRVEGWELWRVAVWFVASLLPAGTFIAEAKALPTHQA